MTVETILAAVGALSIAGAVIWATLRLILVPLVTEAQERNKRIELATFIMAVLSLVVAVYSFLIAAGTRNDLSDRINQIEKRLPK